MVRIVLCCLLIIPFISDSTLGKEIPGFMSINCGGNESSEDKYGLTWIGDKEYVKTGTSAKIPDIGDKFPQYQNNRVFTSLVPKKNCYTIPVEEGVKILIRTTFFYYNYDGSRNPPTFDVHIDANKWDTVETDFEEVRFKEAIFTPNKSSTNICFGRTRVNHNPFVSTIMVRVLNSDMYNALNSGQWLLMYLRRDYGWDGEYSYGYPDDRHDRLWAPKTDGFTALNSSATNISTSMATNEPPELMLQTAIQPIRTSNIQIGVASSEPTPAYLVLYFSETTNASTSQLGNRSFFLHLNGEQVRQEALVPPYGAVLQHKSVEFVVSENSAIDLVPAPNSTLPPILNGMELFWLKNLTQGTFKDDVMALSTMQKNFEVLEEWSGDPCLPKTFNWEWVECNSNDPVRVTKLFLSGYGLSGTLPNFGRMRFLEYIDFHNNSLNGPIPDFLGTLPYLKILNLSDNDFDSIPDSLKSGKNIQLDVSGNPKLARQSTLPSPQPNREHKVLPSTFFITILLALMPLIKI